MIGVNSIFVTGLFWYVPYSRTLTWVTLVLPGWVGVPGPVTTQSKGECVSHAAFKSTTDIVHAAAFLQHVDRVINENMHKLWSAVLNHS